MAVQVAIDRSTALALVGRPNEAIAVAEAGLIDHLGLPQPVGLAHPGTHVVNQAFGLIEAGRLGEAEELSRAGYDVAVADRIPVAQIWFAIMLGKIELLRGRIADSRSWYREGASTARLHRFRGPLRLAVAGEAVAEATLGHDVAAATAVEELDSLPPFGFLAADQAIGRAWAVSAGGGPAQAAHDGGVCGHGPWRRAGNHDRVGAVPAPPTSPARARAPIGVPGLSADELGHPRR